MEFMYFLRAYPSAVILACVLSYPVSRSLKSRRLNMISATFLQCLFLCLNTWSLIISMLGILLPTVDLGLVSYAIPLPNVQIIASVLYYQ
jgi:hypothetical protein